MNKHMCCRFEVSDPNLLIIMLQGRKSIIIIPLGDSEPEKPNYMLTLVISLHL